MSEKERLKIERARKRRIKKEYERLIDTLHDLDEDVMQRVDGLIHRAAFMRISLEDYEADINKNGSVELFSQSEHQTPYERARPVVQFYNTTNKNYQSIIKQLTDLLPKEQAEDTLGDLINGLQKPQ